MREPYHPMATVTYSWQTLPMRLALLLALALLACSPAKEPAPSAGSGSGYQALGKKPANARRPTAPPNIEAKALAVGTKAPLFEVKDTAGASWRLADALSKHARVILVFYRGDW
jgi:AhpC/TSA family